jgi:3-hydroxy acid dehydrogenase / malonic semialdehyde reductase
MLKDKTIVITGATSGFGLETARVCAQNGARIVITGRRKERLESLKKELGDAPVHALAFDVQDEGAVKSAFTSLPPEFSKVDVLVNNAGLALGAASYENTSMAHADQMVQTNIMGLLYCTYALLPAMIERAKDSKCGGHIVNVGSIAGSYPYPGGNVYGATKAFVKQFSLNLRSDLYGKNIRVTNIEPGMAETEFSLVRFEGDGSKADNVYTGVDALTAADIAECIVWSIARPAHVNINRMEIMPTQQAPAGLMVDRKK